MLPPEPWRVDIWLASGEVLVAEGLTEEQAHLIFVAGAYGSGHTVVGMTPRHASRMAAAVGDLPHNK